MTSSICVFYLKKKEIIIYFKMFKMLLGRGGVLKELTCNYM